ncbi:hypothetical protein ES705_25768 [subsurface metagenome]
MSTNDTVLCRSFGGEPLVRMVQSIMEEGVLICTQENFELWEKASIDPIIALAPFDAVYEYSEDLFHELDEAFGNVGDRGTKLEQLWRQAKPYKIIEKED